MHSTSSSETWSLIVEAGGAGALVVGHLLRDLELAAIAQVLDDAGGAEGVAPDLRLDAGVLRAAADHTVDVGLAHRPVRELAGATARGAEEPALGIVAELRAVELGLQVAVEVVVGGHVVALPRSEERRVGKEGSAGRAAQ